VNYLFYRRIKGPVFLLTFGVTALLAQWHILGFARSWPLYLIVYGVMRLLEGAVLAASIPALTGPTVSGGSGYSTPGFSAPDYGTPGYSSTDYVAPGGSSTDYVAPVYPPVGAPASSTGLTTVAPAAIQTTEEKS
jgi:hypothetical protein